jgi:hypothetical protein
VVRLGGTSVLEKERLILDEQLGVDAKAVTDRIVWKLTCGMEIES